MIDTNVWCMPDGEHTTEDAIACAETCRVWLNHLYHGEQQIVVDDGYVILGEYRDNLRKGRFAWRLLNELEKAQKYRFTFVSIQVDRNGIAVLPLAGGLEGIHKNDRKFVAVALARDPHPPIVNATDNDWRQHAPAFAALGIYIEELCPDFLKST